jgi:copper homeostasis protein
VSFTFHRAFDWIKDPSKALRQLETLNVDRILTSGQRINVTEGFDNLIAFKNQTSINIMPGGGVNAQNIRDLKKAGFQQIHFSGTTKELRNYHQTSLSFVSEAFLNEDGWYTTEEDKVKNMIDLVK